MDLQTENQIATILMREAAELRRQAEKEGVHAYLHKPKARARPNSRFLSATVLGVQQSNKAVEIDEMWRVRQKEIELDNKLQRRPRSDSSSKRHMDSSCSPSSMEHKETGRRGAETCCSSEDGLRDEEIEEFLHSRLKRGRGAVGSRMDETGPYLPPAASGLRDKSLAVPDIRVREDWEHRVLGPEKPSSLKSWRSCEIDSDSSWKSVKKVESDSSKRHRSKKHKSKDKTRDKKKEKTSKHRSKSKSRKE